MMANYFEKLTRIFLVSENYLFHAAAWSRYYSLLRQSAATVSSGQSAKKDNPSVNEADMTRAASFVLLSALSIPVISTSRSRGALVEVDEARKNKSNRLTNLLGMSSPPTRSTPATRPRPSSRSWRRTSRPRGTRWRWRCRNTRSCAGSRVSAAWGCTRSGTRRACRAYRSGATPRR